MAMAVDIVMFWVVASCNFSQGLREVCKTSVKSISLRRVSSVYTLGLQHTVYKCFGHIVHCAPHVLSMVHSCVNLVIQAGTNISEEMTPFSVPVLACNTVCVEMHKRARRRILSFQTNLI
jgi:hypothetical protein